jgi:hypothetical protein
LQVSKRIAIHGLNVSLAVFTGIAAYGVLNFMDGGLEAAIAAPPRTTFLLAAAIAGSVAGICWFGMQLDRRKTEDRLAEARVAAEEAARKGKRKLPRRKAD